MPDIPVSAFSAVWLQAELLGTHLETQHYSIFSPNIGGSEEYTDGLYDYT